MGKGSGGHGEAVVGVAMAVFKRVGRWVGEWVSSASLNENAITA